MSRLALIDSDILLYEVGFGAQQKDPVTGLPSLRSWDWVEELLDLKLRLIQEESGATSSLLFFTNTPIINQKKNKYRQWIKEPVVEFVPNFREELAVSKEYKAGRKQEKPHHFYNILAHLLGTQDCHIHEDGLEADDGVCIRQYKSWQDQDTIICSRDKDVRQCPGLHFSWEMGAQAAIGPMFVDTLGHLELRDVDKVDKNGRKKPIKIFGTGAKFFYAQLVMGDTVDNIGGLKKKGPAVAYNLLKDATSERECYELVSELYQKDFEDDWKIKIKEQASLLWMIREYDEKGRRIDWRPPDRV